MSNQQKLLVIMLVDGARGRVHHRQTLDYHKRASTHATIFTIELWDMFFAAEGLLLDMCTNCESLAWQWETNQHETISIFNPHSHNAIILRQHRDGQQLPSSRSDCEQGVGNFLTPENGRHARRVFSNKLGFMLSRDFLQTLPR